MLLMAVFDQYLKKYEYYGFLKKRKINSFILIFFFFWASYILWAFIGF